MHDGVCHAFGKVKGVTLIDIIGPFDSSADYPAAKIVRRYIGGRTVVHIEPVNTPTGFGSWCTNGGAFVATSDSRFGEAVSLHDRYESAEVSRQLSI
jgi:hypothetical protein